MPEGKSSPTSNISSEHRFQLLVESVLEYAIYLLDVDGRVASWNAGAERITGYTEPEILGQPLSQFYTREDKGLGLPLRALRTAAEVGRHEEEGWRVRKDGSRFRASVVIDAIHDNTGALVGFAKITRDITERQAAQDALRASERQLRMLVAGMTDHAFYMLDPNGIVTSWNAGAERIKGYSADEIIGRHFSLFYTEADRAAGMPTRTLRSSLDGGRYEAEGWRVRKDGTLFWANIVVEPILEEDNTLIGFGKITRDVTERRNAQRALQRTQEQLAQAQKMEALGQLTGGVAHDFNNLLMIVSGHVQLLRSSIADNPQAVRAADAIELAARRGEALTRRLLTFSRRQKLNPEPVELATRVDAFRTMLSSSLRSGVVLAFAGLENLWPIQVDLGEFELALMNLVLNARDAMPEGGTITVAAENVTLRPGQRGLDLRGDFVALTVTDEGVGIPDDILLKVFDPFFTTKPADQGTGLGLSQVHGFAHQSGGNVTIRSQVGRGTSVTLYVPRAQNAPAGERDPIPVEQSGSGRVLVVEDNPEVAAVSTGLLDQLGYQCTTVHSAEAALAAIKTGKDFDLVFSDIVMSGPMDGIALAQKLDEEFPLLPILLTTGYSGRANAAAHNFPVLYKPYQATDLGQAVAQAIARRLEQGNESSLVDFNAAKRKRSQRQERP
jgi:PAS domain S-box-containing protein